MKIFEIIWPHDRVEHIARHKVEPYEVDEVCFSNSFVLRAKSYGESNVYFVLGQTRIGRYLFCLIIHLPDGKGYPITAREMTEKEKKRLLHGGRNEPEKNA